MRPPAIGGETEAVGIAALTFPPGTISPQRFGQVNARRARRAKNIERRSSGYRIVIARLTVRQVRTPIADAQSDSFGLSSGSSFFQSAFWRVRVAEVGRVVSVAIRRQRWRGARPEIDQD
jgi:hypothetical protein